MSRFATTVGVVAVGVALAASGAGLSIAIAGAAPEPYRVQAVPAAPVNVERPEPLDLSSLDAINEYLRSRGFDPTTFVVQRGPRNYAGPNCPGLGWNCTTATRVVQIATGGTLALSSFSTLDDTTTTANEAECVPEEDNVPIFVPPAAVGCAIVQTALVGPEVDQQASCKVESSTVPKKQFCEIDQFNGTGGDNQAAVTMKIDANVGTTQLADQDGFVFQDTVGGGNNQVQADQTIALAAKGSATTQDGYQSLDLNQGVGGTFIPLPPPADDEIFVPGSGNNQAEANQSQNLTAYTANGGTQSQNAGTAEFGDPCSGEVDDANSCVDYDQDTGTGINELEVNQQHDLKATSASTEVTQVQGCDPMAREEDDKPCGLEEVGFQETDEESKNRAAVVQGGTWVLEAPDGPPAMVDPPLGPPVPCSVPREPECEGLAQIQDPRIGGAGTFQVGGKDDHFTLQQLANLQASDDPAVALQSHENFVDDQSTGDVMTKSTIVLNDDPPSVVTCSSEGQRCTYEQQCTNVEPVEEDPTPPLCPRNGEGTVPPTTTTTPGEG